MRNKILPLLFAVGLVATLTACSTGAASGPEINTDSDLHRVFALMPDTDESRRFLRIVGVQATAEYVGTPPPGEDATAEELLQWKGLYTSAVLEIVPRHDLYLWFSPDELLSGTGSWAADSKNSLGFDARNVDIVAITGILAAGNKPITELVLGDISAEAASAGMADCPECPTHETLHRSDVTYYSWGEDFRYQPEDGLSPPAFDRLGRGGRIRVGDGHAYRTLRTVDMEAAIDAETANGPNLLDDEDWRLAADALSHHDFLLVTATEENVEQVDAPQVSIVRNQLDSLDPPWDEWYQSYPELATTLTASSPTLPDHRLAVTGVAGTGDGLEVALALVFANEATAQEAADALRQRVESGLWDAQTDGVLPWNESVVSAQFTAEGRVVIGRIDPTEGEYVRFLTLPAIGVGFTGGSQPDIGPTAEFLLH